MTNTKILCVDDEPELVDLIAEIVSGLGFEVLTALNVGDAFQIVERESARLALVLSDHGMPGKSGFDLRQLMLETHKQIPFVLVSGQVSRETALEAIELKISGFLAKPFKRQELEQIIAAQSKDRVASILEEDELREGFVNDAEILINEMENLLLALENDLGSTEGLDRLFACAHTIKGASGFFKPNTVHQFVHRFEDFLSPFKKGEHRLDAAAVQTLLSGLDTIKDLIRALAEQTTPPPLELLVKVFEGRRETAAAPTGEGRPRTEGATSRAQKTEDEIRVPITVLNDFMETSGEITVLRNMVNKVLQGLELTRGEDAHVAMLSELMSEMHKSISFMQDKIEDLKKVPVSHLVRPLNRTLRDLCGSLRKKIQLEIEGEQLRVDHHLAEVLGKCLIHLLRNAADHGIEPPEARVTAGKTEQGHLRIAFSETTEHVLVKITDDGKGIDAARIKRKALEKQLITPEEAARKTDDEIRLLIFEAGFSTAEQVSDVSGRGVGMDMVRQTIADAGGRVELKSIVGQGTELTLRLPVPKSVMIINALLVRFKDQTYALPQDSVDRIVTLEEPGVFERLKKIGDVVFAESQGRLDPILGLDELFGGERTPVMPKGYLVRVRGTRGSFFLLVDDVIGVEDIVVKPIAAWFRKLKIYKGATFLGDGKVGLVLDAEGILDLKSLRTEAHSEPTAAAEHLPTESFLLFTTGDGSTYALPQGSIFRIERQSRLDLEKSGEASVIVYRDRVLPITDLRHHPSDSADWEMIVANAADGGLHGVLVEHIGDLVEAHVRERPLTVINGRVVTLVTTAELLAQRVDGEAPTRLAV